MKDGSDVNTSASRELNAQIGLLEAKQKELESSKARLAVSAAAGLVTSGLSILLMCVSCGLAAPIAVTAGGAAASLYLTYVENIEIRANLALEKQYLEKFHKAACWTEGMELKFPRKQEGETNKDFQSKVLASLIEQVENNEDNSDGSRMDPKFLDSSTELIKEFKAVYEESIAEVDEMSMLALEQLSEGDWFLKPFSDDSNDSNRLLSQGEVTESEGDWFLKPFSDDSNDSNRLLSQGEVTESEGNWFLKAFSDDSNCLLSQVKEDEDEEDEVNRFNI